MPSPQGSSPPEATPNEGRPGANELKKLTQDPKWTEALLEKAVAGKAQIQEGATVVPYELTPSQRQEFVAAKARGFVYISATGSDFALDNAFYRWCSLKRRPFVKVRRKLEYASVEMDLAELPVHNLAPAAERAIAALFRSNSRSAANFRVGAWSNCQSVLVEKAAFVASELLRLCSSSPELPTRRT